ncbi:MAG TPA: ABC transporter permease [Acidimicrobiales bacterium]|nr:ABC transporter permease [Acidimicrobiales bacterium]
MRRYFARKSITYLLTFFVAVTIDWVIPRLMPGNPIKGLLSKFQVQPGGYQAIYNVYARSFGLNVPWWKQYLNFWDALFHGNLGISIYEYPRPVTSIIRDAVPYTLALLLPAILLSWYTGNKVGALAARRKILDNTALPLSYTLTATPYMWLALVLAFALASVARIFPISGGYSYALLPSWSWTFISSLLAHWFLPFATLFLVGFGGWAIGMRNVIIYELEADYSHYLQALGAPHRLVRKYAFRNAMLPQVTGLALQLGTIIGGAVVTEIVFSYPGLGYLILQAIQNGDYFLLQGVFLFIIVGVLAANFAIDIVYVLVDPRTRVGMQGGQA